MERVLFCPNCGHRFAEAHSTLSEATCPSCGTAFSVPLVAKPSGDALGSGYGEAFGLHDAADVGLQDAVKTAAGHFKTLDYEFLLPMGKLFDPSMLRKRAVRWVMLFGLMPLGILQLVQWFDLSFAQTAWLLEIYFCLFWALYFFSLIRPTHAIWKKAIGYAAFTAIVGIPLLLAAEQLPLIRNLIAGSDSESFVPRLLGYVLGVGLFEETCKAFPLLFFGLRKKEVITVRAGLFLGFMSGLGFAAAEGVQYTLSAAIDASRYGSEQAFTAQILMTVFRFMSGPILHASWAGIVGWFVAVASTRQAPRWPIVAVGIAFTAFLHGINDVFASSVLQLVIAAATFLIFLAYVARSEEVGSEGMAGGLAGNKPAA
jgi:RsiW-degrading membrane proteinase PrsW (M82 family)